MTKEELKEEAEEYADWFWGASPSMMKALANAYIKGAEPREKRIAELEDINKELFHALSNHDRDVLLTNKKIAELEAQIKKMKCCRNCKKLDNRKVECSEGSDLIYFFGKNCDKWEIKEK